MKVGHLFAIAATPLLFASCSDADSPVLDEGENVVTITAELPAELGTRAFGDGTTAKRLQYAVYEKGATGALKVFDNGTKNVGTATMTDKKATVQLRLTTGKTYDVVFWADATTGSPYTFNADNRNVTVDYTNAAANDENRDAFYTVKEITVSGNDAVSAELRRPFAQLNIGSNDVAAAKAAGVDASNSEVTVALGNTLNLLNGNVEGTVENRTFKMAAVPAAGETFPVAGYDYLSMNYLLVGVDKTVADVAFTAGDGAGKNVERTFTSVPLQRNYRTNIYGSLLTNTIDFNVEIKPEFEGTTTISTDAELAAAAACPGRHIQIADNTTLTLPDAIAENVVITGGSGSALKGTSSIAMTIGSDDVTFRNITFNSILYVNADNVTLDNVKIGAADASTSTWGFIGVTKAGATLTIKDIASSKSGESGLLTYVPNVTFILENCDFGKNFKSAINLTEAGDNKVIAKNCKFYGRLNGMADSSFEDCTFDCGNAGYPDMRIFGNATFKNCTFGKHGKQFPSIVTGAVYDYDYAVVSSKPDASFVFDGCKYSDGSAIDTKVMRYYADHGPIQKVTIDGTVYTSGFGSFKIG